jgi:large subunit ribosomal protein L24|tara:strand:- start:5106 stop:5369 length:264 start_codon:yes stop_codon:yes gene_type:complete
MKNRIKAGDEVVVIAGNDKGSRGSVLSVIPSKNRVLVENVNKRKHHEKAKSENEPGGITERENPIHISNVMLASRYDEKVGSKQKTS